MISDSGAVYARLWRVTKFLNLAPNLSHKMFKNIHKPITYMFMGTAWFMLHV